jgi:hypothetical protein
MTTGINNMIALGARIHRWTVVAAAEPLVTRLGRTRPRWVCRCVCGTQRTVLQQSLQRALRSDTGGSRSCGCLAIERATCHGHAAESRPTGEYTAWLATKKRCGNPRNASCGAYGGRGIRMCRRWAESFEAFLEDLGPKPHPEWSLDRISSDGGYEPGNCRWAPPIVQSRNRRSTRWFVFEGQVCTIGEVARFLGITRDQARALEREGRLSLRIAEAGPVGANDLAAEITLDLNAVAPAADIALREVGYLA